MKTVVVYTSQTGFTKRYAQWIAEDLGCEAVSLGAGDFDAGSFDVVVCCGWCHAVNIVGSKEYKSQIAAHPDTSFVMVGVGATPLEEKDQITEFIEQVYPKATYPHLPVFYLHGGFSYEKLSLGDKLGMKIMFKMLKSKAAKGDEAAGMARAMMMEGFDATDRAAIEPVVACVRAMKLEGLRSA